MNNSSKSIILLISKATTVIINLISMMIVARYLSVTDYSEYRQITVVITLITSIFALGLPSSMLYFLTSDKKYKYLPNFYISILIIFITLIPISLICLYYFDYNFNTSLFTKNLLLLLLIILLSFLSSCMENLFISFNKFKLVFLNAFLPNALFMLLLLYGYVEHKQLSFLLFSLLFREITRLFILLQFFFITRIEWHELSIHRLKEIFVFTLPVAISAIIGALNSNIDKLIIGKILDKQAFAIIAVASYEIPILSLIGVSLFNILIPTIKQNYEQNRINQILELWDRAGKVMITVVVPLTISITLFSKEIIVFLFSDKYLDTVNLFVIYQLNALTRIYFYGAFFMAVGLNKIYTKNALINLLLNIIFNLIFIKLFGLLGVAIANVLSTQIMIFIQSRQISKLLDVDIKNLFPYKELVKAIFICLLIVTLILNVYTHLFNGELIVGLIFMSVSFIICLLVLSNVTNNEILQYMKKRYFSLRKRINFTKSL